MELGEFFDAVLDEEIEIMEQYLEEGGNINEKSSTDTTALWFASRFNRPNSITFLVERGASINLQGSGGRTPFYEASRRGDIKLMKFLLKRGADITISSHKGITPLEISMQFLKWNATLLLMKYGKFLEREDQKLIEDSKLKVRF